MQLSFLDELGLHYICKECVLAVNSIFRVGNMLRQVNINIKHDFVSCWIFSTNVERSILFWYGYQSLVNNWKYFAWKYNYSCKFDYSVRGVINIVGFLMTSLGNLIEFVIAMFIDFRMQAVCALAIPLLFVLSISFVPESPEFLYKNHEIEVNIIKSLFRIWWQLLKLVRTIHFFVKLLGNTSLEFYKGPNASLESEKYTTDAKIGSKKARFSDWYIKNLKIKR